MRCIFCNSNNTRVIETRDLGNTIRRRRECLNCKGRFTTYERIEYSPIIVVKKNGSKERFNIEKIKQGVLKACEKRPVTPEQINIIANKIEAQLLANGKRKVTSKEIGLKVIKHLKRIDKVAYIRFASVYKEFRHLADFKDEIKRLNPIKHTKTQKL